MKQKSKNRLLAALLAAAMMFQLLPLMVFAEEGANSEGAASDVKIERTGKTYASLEDAIKDTESGDIIQLGEGNYTLYDKSNKNNPYTKGKKLTFVGQGPDKTAWNIGAEVPDPSKYGTEYNGDYSFDGADTVTFQNMTLRSGTVDYLGFIRPDYTIVENCIVDGTTHYWGYKSTKFSNSTFYAPEGNYSVYVYSSAEATFDNCIFNAHGKAIKIYNEGSTSEMDVTFKNCKVNSTDSGKPALNIDDRFATKYTVHITGNNDITAAIDKSSKTSFPKNSCSKIFGFGDNNTGHTDVYLNDELVWSNGQMVTHDYTDGEKEGKVTVTATDWVAVDDHYERDVTKTCQYCGYEEKKHEIGYKVSYDLNGSPSKDDDIYTSDEPQAEITLPEPTWEGHTFKGWRAANGVVYNAGDKIKVTADTKLTAIWEEDTAGEDTTTGGSDGSGDAVAGVLIGGAAVIGGYEIATHLILNRVLPDGAPIPSNRAELALLLWEHADKPEPQNPCTFSDIDADNTDLQKAAQWCIENDYLRTKENDDRFFPRIWVTKAKVIRTWDKAFGLQAKLEE